MGKSFDEWKEGDGWKGTDLVDWKVVDNYVDAGFLTNEEREALHAWGNMKAAELNFAEKFTEIDDAYGHFNDLETKGIDIKDVKSPDYGEPSPDVDYYAKVGAGKWSDEKPPADPADPPKVPGGGGEQGSDTAINTEAITLFGTNMLELKVMIDTSFGYLENIDVKPGVFYDGVLLRDKVMGAGETPGLKYDTREFMRNASETMWDLHTDTTKLVRDYDTVEELNGLSSQKLEKIMMETYSDIDYSDQFSGQKSIGKNEGGDDVRSA